MNSSPIDLIHLIERLHRLSLDVVRMELKKQGIRDLSGVQAMILAHINEKEIVVRDLVERGYYQGSNVSYNVRKLTELGYLEQRRAEHDKRSVIIRLTDKALGVAEHIRSFDADFLRQVDGGSDAADALAGICAYLRNIEQTWSDYLKYSNT